MSKKIYSMLSVIMTWLAMVLAVGVVLVVKKVEDLEGENARQRLEINSLKKENQSISDKNNDSQGYINFLESQNAMLIEKKIHEEVDGKENDKVSENLEK